MNKGINNYSKTSKLSLIFSFKENMTYLEDVYFTAPFKVMAPFQKENGQIEVMVLSASAGIMEGDEQEVSIVAKEGVSASVTSQSYEKIHKMKEGRAGRITDITVDKDARFVYNPLPVIPFKDSAFKSKTRIYLEDTSSEFIFSDIISPGRKASGELFEYRCYYSDMEVYAKDNLIYKDNTRYEPSQINMSCIGIMEGFTHQGNLMAFNLPLTAETIEKISRDIEKTKDIEGGLTKTASGDIAVKLLGKNAQVIAEKIDKYQKYFIESSN